MPTVALRMWLVLLVTLLVACGRWRTGNDGGEAGGSAGGVAGGTAGGTSGGSSAGGTAGGAAGGAAGGVAGGVAGGAGGGPIADGGVIDAGSLGDGGVCSARIGYYVDVPMRDLKTLRGYVDRAADPSCAQPVVLIQTPYNIENAKGLGFGADRAQHPLFSSPDYAYVLEDWRGYFASRPADKTPATPGDDGYDTVEWLAAQPWTNGKIGTWGASALCGQQYKTAAKQPPHLAAMVPIFCDVNNTYRQTYPGGIYRREMMEFITLYYLLGNLYEQHPTQDFFWNVLGAAVSPANVSAPAMVVVGWHDLHGAGSVAAFNALRTSSAMAVRGEHRLLGGPWIHFATGGETAGTRPLTPGELTWADPGREIQRQSVAWFDFKLRGVTGGASAWQPVRFLSANETGFSSAGEWPPSTSMPSTWYLDPSGALVTGTVAAQKLDFAYDPADPSPTRGGSTLCPRWGCLFGMTTLFHGPYDQAAVLARADQRTFVSAPLGAPLRLQGPLEATLEVSTPASDTDFMVRVTDVDGAGVHTLVGEGARRLKLRSSDTTPAAVVANQRYTLDLVFLNDVAWTLPAGHRLGLIVSSSNWPLYEKNPNNGQDFPSASPAPVATVNSIYTGVSRLVLRVAP